MNDECFLFFLFLVQNERKSCKLVKNYFCIAGEILILSDFYTLLRIFNLNEGLLIEMNEL